VSLCSNERISSTCCIWQLYLNLTAAAAPAGKFPVLTVQTIVNIAAQAEKVFDHRYHFDLLMEQSLYAGADNLGASPAGACALCPALYDAVAGRLGRLCLHAATA